MVGTNCNQRSNVIHEKPNFVGSFTHYSKNSEKFSLFLRNYYGEMLRIKDNAQKSAEFRRTKNIFVLIRSSVNKFC